MKDCLRFRWLIAEHGANVLRYHFVIIPLLAVIGALIYFLDNSRKSAGGSMWLRVAFPQSTSINHYEPTKIQLAPQYALLENLFSPLVELAPNGEIRSGVAKRFEWRENELHLEIRDDLTTIDGIKITAKDVEFSLKRLMILAGNTHGNIKDILCPHSDLKSISDACENLEVHDDFLIVFKPPKKDVFLINMLTAIDFAILPIQSVHPSTLEITDYRNTSGPFYVEKDDQNGNIVLAANPFHYHYTNNIPQKIQLVPIPKDKPNLAIELFKEDKVDFITEADSAKSEEIISFSKIDQNATLHSTINIRMFVLSYTAKGIKTLSSEERFLIGQKFKSIVRKLKIGKGGYESSDQFFPVFGEGSLSKENEMVLASKFASLDDGINVEAKNLKLGFIRLGDTSDLEKSLKVTFPKLKTFETSRLALNKMATEDPDMPEMVLSGPDTGFLEDIGLISYTLNIGILGMTREQAALWLKDYMDTIEKKERLAKLQRLHFEALIEPNVVPLVSSPYVALVRKPWTLKLPKYFANNSLWLVEKK